MRGSRNGKPCLRAPVVTSSLRIGRLHNEYLAPRDHPAPECLRSELDEAARRYVPDSCGQALSLMLDPGDASVWVIDRISVDLLMDITILPAEQIAAIWARRMAESVVKTMASGEDGERVMRFPNRAAYLAHFLRDLAGGSAWNKWYYGQFDSLRSLPLPAAIREALFREPDLAEPALLQLMKINAVKRVLGCLSGRDHELLLELCTLQQAVPSWDCFQSTLDVFKGHGWRRPLPALELYLQVRMEHPEHVAGEVRGAVGHVLTFQKWAQHSRLSTILEQLERNQLAQIMAGLPPEEQETGSFLYFHAAANPELLEKIDEIAQAETAHEGMVTASGSETGSTSHFESSFGGVFLLLVALAQSRELMRVFGREADTHLRYLLLLTCMGTHAADAWRDPAFWLAAGLTEAPDAVAFQQVQQREKLDPDEHDLLAGDMETFNIAGRELFPGASLGDALGQDLATGAAALMRAFARNLPGLARSSPEYLWRNILSGQSRITVGPCRILVQLTPRPLQIIVRMAGLHQMNVELPGKPGTQVTIRFDEE